MYSGKLFRELGEDVPDVVQEMVMNNEIAYSEARFLVPNNKPVLSK